MESYPSEKNSLYDCMRWIKHLKPTQEGCEHHCGKNYRLVSDRNNPGICDSQETWSSSVHFDVQNDVSDDSNYVCSYPRHHECEKYCGDDFHYMKQTSYKKQKIIECYKEEPLLVRDYINHKETIGVAISNKPMETEDGIKYECMRIETRELTNDTIDELKFEDIEEELSKMKSFLQKLQELPPPQNLKDMPTKLIVK